MLWSHRRVLPVLLVALFVGGCQSEAERGDRPPPPPPPPPVKTMTAHATGIKVYLEQSLLKEKVTTPGTWGYDGSDPAYRVTLIEFTIDGTNVPVPPESYANLFNVVDLILSEQDGGWLISIHGAAAESGRYQANYFVKDGAVSGPDIKATD
ncbi:hypothetical protein QPK87_04875 [Kamptonema cortianum]|nr:hypothetical protein [Geitlerinema splendidum]MDK3155910.1 hypothetical protein [Kamptonema cortianum]